MVTTATSSRTSLLLAAALALGLSSAACGPLTPVSPTWRDDVRPILIARCMRCHDGTGNGDPSVTNSTTGSMAYNFNQPADLPSPLPGSIQLLATFLSPTGPANVVRGKGVPRRMPPPPLEALEDWQVETLEIWASSPR